MPSSYRQTGRLPPLRYRTPSPPVDAFEPHTPTVDLPSSGEAPIQWPATPSSRKTSEQSVHGQSNHLAQRTQSHSSHDSMNAFASIVLSNSWPRPDKFRSRATAPNQHSSAIEQNDERPTKRARSEKLPSPAWIRTAAKSSSRPVTSYESAKDSRTLEAELLLNFSHAARFATASTAASAHLRPSSSGHSDIKASQEEKASPSTGRSDCLTYPRSHDTGYPSVARETVDLQHLSGSTVNTPGCSSTLSKQNVNRAVFPELPPQDFRHQLIEASKFGWRSIDPSAPQVVRSSAAPRPLRQDRYSPDHVGVLRGSRGTLNDRDGDRLNHGRGGHLDEDPVDLKLSPVFNAEKDCILESRPINRARRFADSYWPSMLATTVEQSVCASKIRPQETLQQLESRVSQLNNRGAVLHSLQNSVAKATPAPEPAVCVACNFTRNSMSAETDTESTSWISCDGCKKWFHFACAGFKSEREVRSVDKYRCRGCKKVHGPTTYVRKSARAHTAIDYAGLNQGVVKTSDERPEHHYIKPIRDGTINIQPESFARMRPELVTAEHFEQGNGMKEPIVIPAEFNPRPAPAGAWERSVNATTDDHSSTALLEDWFACDPECRNVPDHGQDALDMVIPHNLTVRKVAELYGPEEKIEVIDVKSQNGEGKKWNMRRWVDYYENASKKVVRNVISLEVSQSILGRLIRRPQIVRDLDLQDSVWPAELQAKGESPHVQFYCLMSVADCFTDFHIDFGGSSVFYHILKGKKTFFFIPPKEKHLKKYEEWCKSPAQNWTFLGDQTKECYRVDLSEGDTMLIPAGWIHAVWTPEDSLVIGGNFLTRLNYSMQLRIAQVEKTTGVARKFRYPHFQKIQWYTAIRYLENDPLPADVRTVLESGGLFHRQSPAYHDFNLWGENSRNGRENYHARYYSQPELEGLPDMVRYLLRTALIDSGEITEGITVDARNAVKKSIPRGYGEPMGIVRDFAIWCAWKRGNESIPHWAHADAVRKIAVAESTANLSVAALKKIDPEVAVQAPRRHSKRNQLQQAPVPASESGTTRETIPPNKMESSENTISTLLADTETLRTEPLTPYVVSSIDDGNNAHVEIPSAGDSKRRKLVPGSGTGSQRKSACESCRRRRRACKHETDPTVQTPPMSYLTPTTVENQEAAVDLVAMMTKAATQVHTNLSVEPQPNENPVVPVSIPDQTTIPGTSSTGSVDLPRAATGEDGDERITYTAMHDPAGGLVNNISFQKAESQHARPKRWKASNQRPSATSKGRGRSKACNECRKSKVSYHTASASTLWLMTSQRRCLHDQHGLEDPTKIRGAAHPMSPIGTERRRLDGQSPDAPVQSKADDDVSLEQVFRRMSPVLSTPPLLTSMTEEDAQTAARGADLRTEHAKTDNGLPSNIQEPQASLLRNNALHPIPDERSANHTRTLAEDFTPPSQDASGLQLHAELSTKTPINALKHEIPPVQLESSASFGQPAASSLVSPPASSHEDSEQPNQGGSSKPTYSGSSSRRSSPHRQAQRFTPESGPTRRYSSSSAVVNTPAVEERWSSTFPPDSSTHGPDSAQKQAKARLHSDNLADEESLKLIRALQAQDYGLRRRSRAV